jgi:hypothetical protein
MEIKKKKGRKTKRGWKGGRNKNNTRKKGRGR